MVSGRLLINAALALVSPSPPRTANKRATHANLIEKKDAQADNLVLALERIKHELENAPPPETLDESDGPFATTLGEWDGEGDKPNYQLPMDWHITSTFDEEQKAAAQMEAEAAVANPDTGVEESIVNPDELWAPVEPYEEPKFSFMEYESGNPEPMNLKSTTAMPKSWQEYQYLQDALVEMSQLTDSAIDTKDQQRALNLSE